MGKKGVLAMVAVVCGVARVSRSEGGFDII